MLLFDEDEFGVGGQEVDDTNITTTILYMSEEELKEFKALAKKGIKIEFGEEYQQKGNLTDFLLKLLREKYDQNNNGQANSN